MEREAAKRIARAASVVSSATLLSRILGFVRDMVIAKLFGAGMATDAFFVAFRLPNMLRELLGEGALSAAFIPVFTESLAQKGREAASELFRKTFTLLSLILIGVSLLGTFLAPLMVVAIAPGFTASPEMMDLTVFLAKMMFPYIFFIGLSALLMGVLNALEHFAIPALSPAVLNVAIIVSAVGLADRFEEPILSLGIGVLVGGLGQLLLQIPLALKRGISFRPTFELRDPILLRIGRLMTPGAAGLAITQINVFIGTLLASFLAEGSVSYLYYAFRLIHLPIGLIGVALATAILPALSVQAATRPLEELKETLVFSLRLAFFVTFPAMVGLLTFRVPIIHLLFERGEFTRHETLVTAEVLFFYAFGVCFYVLNRVIVPVFYALQDTRTPVLIGAVSVLANVTLSLLLIPSLQVSGLALATALSSSIGFSLLFLSLRRRLGSLHGKNLLSSFTKTSFSSLSIVLVGGMVLWRQELLLGAGTLKEVLLLGVALFGSLVLFLLSSRLLKCEELRFLLEAFGFRPRRWQKG